MGRQPNGAKRSPVASTGEFGLDRMPTTDATESRGMSSVEKSEIESECTRHRSRVAKRGVPEGLWIGCDGCKQTVYRQRVDENE